MKTAALLLPLALAACSTRRVPTEAVLRDRGIVRPTVSTEIGWLLGYCRWTEPYVARFVGMFEGRLVTGTVCATGENAEDARLVDVHRPWPELRP
ncbi:hypothetical protein [Methylobacterium gnaphalii]|uniref:Lipoprotein n=1 Tax=Methylobacterium gnaphalii TaxID=1010610 RepID=A0A512JIS0_9HYPH|nr:hypothetical protein [Methylobacterium gnaphalii]GEP09857.1 hypothetical protein MGN01_17020 [Methylobacterium gnaphalii]GJD67228.1 hypothetical protein MMMDOFMJ_0142 [Methylobacterium gnaphalii]GLS49886.1 hypothetical protein GCM10007885_27380 [Methylobacterium gnaphalii]